MPQLLPRTPGVPSRVCYKKKQIAWFPTAFQPYLPTNEKEVRLCRPMESMFWTNEKLFLIVAWSASVSISCSEFYWPFGLVFFIAETLYFLEGTQSVLEQYVLRFCNKNRRPV